MIQSPFINVIRKKRGQGDDVMFVHYVPTQMSIVMRQQHHEKNSLLTWGKEDQLQQVLQGPGES